MPSPKPIESASDSIMDIAKARHSAKAYADNALTDDEIAALLDLLRYSASSVNSQPWHFIVATTDEGRDRIAKAGTDENYPFNSDSVRKAGMVVVFAGRIEIGEDYQERLLEREDSDGRFPEPKNKAEMRELRKGFIDASRDEDGSAEGWMARQVYWNGGQFLLGAAALGLDATPMEGIDVPGLNAAFDLEDKGYNALFAITVGRNQDADDWNFKLPKSRLPLTDIVTRL